MAHGWYPMDAWTATNAWAYPSPMMPQSQWGMTNGWSSGFVVDPAATIQGQENQWRMNTGSTASGSGDRWSTRAWTSQDSTRSWSTETT
eukprot:2622266-Amphidinium_carterae.1